VSDQEYKATQDVLTEWVKVTGAMLGILDLEGFIDRLARADTLGWVLDPTLAMRAADGVRQVDGVARIAQTTLADLRRLAGVEAGRL
jgi:hypothetical protein